MAIPNNESETEAIWISRSRHDLAKKIQVSLLSNGVQWGEEGIGNQTVYIPDVTLWILLERRHIMYVTTKHTKTCSLHCSQGENRIDISSCKRKVIEEGKIRDWLKEILSDLGYGQEWHNAWR